jgi:hypothetical protein
MKIQIKQNKGPGDQSVVNHATISEVAKLLEKEFSDCPLFTLTSSKATSIVELHFQFDLLSKSIEEVRLLFEEYGLARSLRSDYAIFAFQITLFSLKYNLSEDNRIVEMSHWSNSDWNTASQRAHMPMYDRFDLSTPAFWTNSAISPKALEMVRQSISLLDMCPTNKFEEFVRLHGLRYMYRKLLAYFKYAREYHPIVKESYGMNSEKARTIFPFFCVELAERIEPLLDGLGTFTPIIIELNGPAGVGKTTFARFIAHVIGSRLPYLPASNYLYSRANDKFWNGYEHQPVVLYDDPNQGRISYDLGFELIAIGGGVFTQPPMAFEKNMAFCSFVVIVTTNRRLSKSRLRVDKQALNRRIVTLTFTPFSTQTKYLVCDENWTQFLNLRPVAVPKFLLLSSIFEGNLATVLQKYNTVSERRPSGFDKTSSVREFCSCPVSKPDTATRPLLVSEADPVSLKSDCDSIHTAYSRKQVADREGIADLSTTSKPVTPINSSESIAKVVALLKSKRLEKHLRERLVLSSERLERNELKETLVRFLKVLIRETKEGELRLRNSSEL